jgi:hypothetical protein
MSAAGIGLNSVNVSGSLKPGIANFDNYGTLAKTGGTGTSHFAANYTATSGKVSVSTGTLEFDGLNNTFSSGTISGTGRSPSVPETAKSVSTRQLRIS